MTDILYDNAIEDCVARDTLDSLNADEKTALLKICSRWETITSQFYRDSMMGCIFGQVDGHLWLGIESDGHTHS